MAHGFTTALTSLSVACRVALALAAGWPALARAAEPEPMPMQVQERLWITPGPVQDGADAPRLLIVYPRPGQTTTGEDATRYAGRVEPETATVTLNGEALKVWPGGVFTGTRALEEGQSETWLFAAGEGEAVTRVERAVTRTAPPPPAPRTPLSFFASPVSPAGTYWLPAGETLSVMLWASPGARAEVRIGEQGDWQPMTAGLDEPRRGQQYTARLRPRAVQDAPPAAPPAVEFRLLAGDGASTAPALLTSKLRLGLLPATPPPGRIAWNRGTFLKDAGSWERWGNWTQGTPFAVLGIYGDRIRTGFKPGPSGYVETEQAAVDWLGELPAPPRLSVPTIDPVRGNQLILEWEDVREPLAYVMEVTPDANGDRVRVRLPGVRALPAKEYGLHGSRPFRTLATHAATSANPPWFETQLKATLWGFDMRADPDLQFELRTPPRLPEATTARPLSGMKIMIDAGHGGDDAGALGPSGVAEADLNLVQAAWLERALLERGAIVRQTRRGDQSLSLDERVDLANAWRPDLFISLHHNSVGLADNPMADSGPIVFYHFAQSLPLAQAVAARLTPALMPEKRPRTLARNFRVNRNISIGPSILIETGFVCNPIDETPLRQSETTRRATEAIAQGIVDLMKTQ